MIALLVLIVKSIYHSIGWSTRSPVNSTFDEVRADRLGESMRTVSARKYERRELQNNVVYIFRGSTNTSFRSLNRSSKTAST